MGSQGLVGRRFAPALMAAAVLVTTLGTGPVSAAAPPPPFDPALAWGFRTPASTGVLVVERGVPVTLSAPGGEAIVFEPPAGQVCGERGCPRPAVSWQRERGFQPGIAFLEGCTAQAITCTVSYAPPFIGDIAESYQLIYVEEYLGIQPTGNSRLYALYTPPTVYPIRLDAVDTGGALVRIPPDFVAYAVREGTNPTQADCDTTDWVQAALASAVFPIPDCTTLSRSGDHFSGVLPNDSGTWTVVGAPRGDAAAPLLSRPSPYRRSTVTPRDNNIVATIVAERRPGLAIEVRPETTVMDLGTTQIVDVIVAATGGEAGALERLTFEDAGVLALTGEDAALEVVGISEEAPAGGFSLGIGEQRVFSVELRAVGLGEGAVRAAIGGTDDLGQALRVDQGGPILVEYAEVDGAEAPPAPVIVRALDGGAAGPDVLEGTVEGAPDTTVTVSLAASPVGDDETCSQLMEGDGVTGLGSFPVTIDAEGVGRFTRDGPLGPGTHVYGITVVGPAVSVVGACTRVTEVVPSVSIEDAEGTEGTGKGGRTALTFNVRLSGPSETPLRVVVTTADGSATAPDDYEPLPGTTVDFAPGDTTATVTVDVVRDSDEEPDEDLAVELSSPVGATIAIGTATGTIVNDDGGAAPSSALDLRGRWRVAYPDPQATATVDIKKQDLGSGRLEGVFTLTYPNPVNWVNPACGTGRSCDAKLTGSLSGTRLVLNLAVGRDTLKVSGPVSKRGGKVTATVSGRAPDGSRIKLKLTLTDPVGP